MAKVFIKGFGFVDEQDEINRKLEAKPTKDVSTNSGSAKVRVIDVNGKRKRRATK